MSKPQKTNMVNTNEDVIDLIGNDLFSAGYKIGTLVTDNVPYSLAQRVRDMFSPEEEADDE
jgi:hypothetical protein